MRDPAPSAAPAAPAPMRRYPGSRRFLLAADAGRDARVIRSLAGTSDLRRDAADRVGAGVIALLGVRPLPAAPPWSWPDVQADLLEHVLHDVLPGVRIVAVALPRQAARRRMSMLCTVDDRRIVVKLGVPGDGLDVEATALELLTHDPLPGIATPRLITYGLLPDRLGGDHDVAFLATTGLGLGAQRPAIDEPLRTLETDLGSRLASLPRPADAPADHVPAHGDLAPWNLRRIDRGLALFDWEAAGWAAPGSDLAHYRLTSRELREAARWRPIRRFRALRS